LVLSHQSCEILGGQHFDALEFVGYRHDESAEVLAAD